MNIIMPSVTYGVSRTTEHFPEWLLAQTESAPLTQSRTTVSAKRQTIFPAAIGTTLTAMFVGLSPTEHIEPPTFVQTAQYTTPARAAFAKENGALRDYQTSPLQDLTISEYLRQHSALRDFLRGVATITDDIYGVGIVRTIHMVDDVDTGKPIMELTILSGLPLNDEFDQKDQLLFQSIEASGLAWGLRDVVVTQG